MIGAELLTQVAANEYTSQADKYYACKGISYEVRGSGKLLFNHLG